MKFISENPAQLSGDKEREIFDIGSKFFESALKSVHKDYSTIDLEYLIAAKFYADYQLILLPSGKKLIKVINKEINRRIIERYNNK